MNTENKWLNVTNAASKVASIKIHGVIGGDWYEEGVTAEQVEQDLQAISEIKATTIKVDLASLGGSVMHGMKIYNLLKANSANIEVNVTGWTASMGTVIAMAADEGKLKMVDNNHFLVHEARTFSVGTKAQLEADSKFLDNINNDIAGIYAERTGLSKDDALALMSVNGGEGEFWNASETLDKGFIDSTYKPEKGATASISQEELTKFKINAKIMSKKDEEIAADVVIENKPFDVGAIVKEVVAAVKEVLPKKDEVETPEAVNVEEVISAQVNEAIEKLEAEQIANIQIEKDAESLVNYR